MTSADPPYRRASAAARGWRTFRRWRRGRPFWGGLLTILSGVVFFISGHVTFGNIKIEFAPQEFLGWVIPLILLLCGVLMLVTPAQRIFYGVLGAAVSVGGLIGLNLGGFLLGMLLGMIGGALGASWTPVELPPVNPPAAPPGEDDPAYGEPDGGTYGEPGGAFGEPDGAYGGPDGGEQSGYYRPADAGPTEDVPIEALFPPRGPLTDTLPTSMTSPLGVPPVGATADETGSGPEPERPDGGPLPRRSPRGLAALLLFATAATVALTLVRVQSPAAAAPACGALAVAATPGTKSPAASRSRTASSAPAPSSPAPSGTPSAAAPSPTPSASATGTAGTLAGAVAGLVDGVIGVTGSLLGADPTPSGSQSPSPSAPASPSPSPSAPHTTAPAAPTGTTASPTRAATHPSPSPTGTTSACPAAALAAPADSTKVAEQPSIQLTALLQQVNLVFDGVTALPTASGTVRVLEFSMDSSTSTPFELRVPVPNGHTLDYQSSQLTVSGHVRFYTSKLTVLGISFTPDFPPPVLLSDLPDVTLELVLVRADKLTAPGLHITYTS